MTNLADAIRNIPDYPKPGIMFRDITTLLAMRGRSAARSTSSCSPGPARRSTRWRASRRADSSSAAPSPISFRPGSFRCARGKLPHVTVSIAYSLEYGLDEMEMHEDAIKPGERVILVDDLIATGGTAEGAVKLLRKLGADVVAACFVIDLPGLGGSKKLAALDVAVRSLIAFEGH